MLIVVCCAEKYSIVKLGTCSRGQNKERKQNILQQNQKQIMGANPLHWNELQQECEYNTI